MSEIQAKKSDLFDPKPVIKYAAQKAIESGKDRYVVSTRGEFAFATKPPTPNWSHWKVDAEANLFAHLGGQEVTEYNYEKVGG